MSSPELTPELRRDLLQELASLSSDSEGVGQAGDILRVFTPLRAHRDVLADRTMVIRGDRGTGKTALFAAIREATRLGLSLRTLLDGDVPAGILWLDAFSADEQAHPFSDVLKDLAADQRTDSVIRGYWLGHLAARLHKAEGLLLPEPFGSRWAASPTQPKDWVGAAQIQNAAIVAALEALDARLRAEGRRVAMMYDHLDLLALEVEARRFDYARVLVELWTTLSLRLTALRPKIFLRSDLVRALEGRWPDASKVQARTVELQWGADDLFRLMARHLGARPALRDWIMRHGVALVEVDNHVGWVPTERFATEDQQRRVMASLANPVMGSGSNKGQTHRWIVKRTADANGVVHPRSVIRVLGGAAQAALRKDRTEGPLLLPSELMSGLKVASEGRFQEISEEYKVVERLGALRGRTMLMGRDELVGLLANAPSPGDQHGADGAAALAQLVDIGIVRPEKGSGPPRYDIVDIYRLGIGVKRRGGQKTEGAEHSR